MQIYSDPSRESDPYALPDVEVFWQDEVINELLEVAISKGWYYWFCFPGCLPSVGPFATADEAINAVREEVIHE